MKNILLFAFVIFIGLTPSYVLAGCDWPCKGPGYWSALRSQSYEVNLEDELANNDESLYTIRGFLQSNDTTNSLVIRAYDNWGHVNINLSNAPIYNSFFDNFLPKMSLLISGKLGGNVFIDDSLYTIIYQIVNEHNTIQDPDFLQLKMDFLFIVDTLKGYTNQEIRIWMQQGSYL